MNKLELSDIYPVAYLCCKGFNYVVQKDINPSGKKRVIFIFKEAEKAQGLVSIFYAGQEDLVSASQFSRILKELKSLVFNY